MKYRDETAFRQALQQRLKDRADGDGALLVRNRKRVAFDRLLARLLAVAQEQWVLKGGFAEIEPVEVQAVPLELQVAEKLHAYTRVYEGGGTSTRTKDLIDLVLIAELSQLDAAGLRREIDTIFELRGTHPTPASLPPPPAEWAVPFRQLAEEVEVPADFDAGHRDAAALVDPILSGEVPSGTWDATQRRWDAEKSSEERRT